MPPRCAFPLARLLTALGATLSHTKLGFTRVWQSKKWRSRINPTSLGRGEAHQFFALSTSAFALIHGIMARSFSPTCSIGCCASLARVALNEVWLTLFSSIQLRVKRPDWISARIFFISARVSAVITRGPGTYSPYSAVFEIE